MIFLINPNNALKAEGLPDKGTAKITRAKTCMSGQ